MIAVADCPEHSEILLYRTDDLSVRSAPLVCGVASFEERAIEPGGVYLTRIRTPGGDIDCPCFYVYESCGSLYAVRRQGSLTSELSLLWRAVIDMHDKADRAVAASIEANERVESLIDGYRTE